MNRHLITPSDVLALSRNSSQSINHQDIEVYIEEAEQLDIKTTIGTALYLRLLNDTGDKDANRKLLYGGTYKSCCGEVSMFAGIRKALAYYVYGRIVKNGGRTSTRFGYVEKQGDFSSRVEYKERLDAANDATLVADSYMKETLNYLEQSGVYSEYKYCGRGMQNRRVTIKVIGE